MNTELLSPEAELVQDVMISIGGFSSRLPRLGNYRKTLKDALEYGNHPPSTEDSS